MASTPPLVKKTLLTLAALAMAGTALAAGPKDGIYTFTPPSSTAEGDEFLTIHSNDAGAVIANIYRSKGASAPNNNWGYSTYAMEGGAFAGDNVTEPGTVQGHMFRWAWWDSLSGTIANNVATLEGTSGHLACASKVTVYLDGAQPTITMKSTSSPLAVDRIDAGMTAVYSNVLQRIGNRNRAMIALGHHCAQPAYNFTANLKKWF